MTAPEPYWFDPYGEIELDSDPYSVPQDSELGEQYYYLDAELER